MKDKALIKVSKGIAILSIMGGATLLYLAANDFIYSDYDNTKTLITLFLFAFSCVQLVGGILTYKDEIQGLKISIGCYLVQACACTVGSISYMLSTGPIVFVKYDFALSTLSMDFGVFQVASILNYSGEYNFFQST